MTGSSERIVLLCRPGFEETLAEEFAARFGRAGNDLRIEPGHGIVAASLPSEDAGLREPARPLIFERQRLLAAESEGAPPKTIPTVEAMARGIAARYRSRLAGKSNGGASLSLHIYAVPEPAPKALSRCAARLESALRGVFLDAGIEPIAPGEDTVRGGRAERARQVLQICVSEGAVWSSLMAARELSDPRPGGVHLAKRDAAAPSRSALKIEEVLEILESPPRPKQRVVDLGAAPGGWSHAFLKRGCHVLAVDNGPMTIGGLDTLAGALTHVREDGMRFTPNGVWQPADWWLSDMLVPAGKALGLLRRWVGRGWCRQFVVNIKLPQAHPLPALQPVEDYLASVPGLHYRVRHLFHDRREVTLTGHLDELARRERFAAATPSAARRGNAGKSSNIGTDGNAAKGGKGGKPGKTRRVAASRPGSAAPVRARRTKRKRAVRGGHP